MLSQAHSHFITNNIRGHCLCQLEAFVSGFPWLLAKCIQSHDVLRPIKCEQIYLVHDNEQKLAEQLGRPHPNHTESSAASAKLWIFFLYSIPYFFGGLSINVLIMTQASRDVSTKLKKMFKLKLITPILNDNSLQSTGNSL